MVGVLGRPEQGSRVVSELIISYRETIPEAVVGGSGEHLRSESEGHFERIGAVVVVGDGEFLELVEQEFC